MRIAIGVDETLNSIIKDKLIPMYNKDFNKNLNFEDIINYNIVEFADANILEYFHQKGFFYNEVKPVRHSQEFVKIARDNMCELLFVTSIPFLVCEHAYLDKCKWLYENFDAQPNEIIISGRRDIIKADFLIDDRQENLESFYTKKRLPICINKPWNREYVGMCIDGFDELIDLFNEIKWS